MELQSLVRDVMARFMRKQGNTDDGILQIKVEDAWAVDILCDLPNFPEFRIRTLSDNDVPALQDFGARLGPQSKDLFCPYPWDDPAALQAAFEQAVEQAAAQIDASYLMEIADCDTIGHFFLWKAGGNPHSQRYQLQVPELGVAIADEYQGRGLGRLAVQLLQAVARTQHADAIELTTAQTNEAGWRVYQRCGFEYTGIINIPLGVNVTAAALGEAKAANYRPERQMVYLIEEARRQTVLDYLAANRALADR